MDLVQGLGFRVEGFTDVRFHTSESRQRLPRDEEPEGLGLRVWGLGFRVKGLGFRVGG